MHTLLLYGLSVLIGILTGGLPGFYFLILSRACVRVFRRITLFSTQHGALCVCVSVAVWHVVQWGWRVRKKPTNLFIFLKLLHSRSTSALCFRKRKSHNQNPSVDSSPFVLGCGFLWDLSVWHNHYPCIITASIHRCVCLCAQSSKSESWWRNWWAACGAGDMDWSKVNSGECKSFKDIDTHAHTHTNIQTHNLRVFVCR